ncbi:MAG TPA: HD domain-containing protein [Thermodesulfobacteriota bacterium]|jgi:putative nucleotidyltransferase with HDIG domain|nr:HD domain-containing protein [Thermodesulfobacteriota bacterium]
MKCPGQDMRFWKPGDIFDAPCPKCGRRVEFFKDEVRRECRCGHEIVSPKLDFGCAQWCPYAEQCVGVVPEEVKERQKAEERGLLRERIALEMKKYFGTDFKRVHHAIKVARFAEQILKMEGGNPLVVMGAAYLHDIGIHEASRKYGSHSGHYQEMEGPAIAREILERLNVKKQVIDEVCDILGHHHSPREKETLHFQILYEADGLVNIEEEGISKNREKVEQLIRKVFRTATGKRLAEELYLA